MQNFLDDFVFESLVETQVRGTKHIEFGPISISIDQDSSKGVGGKTWPAAEALCNHLRYLDTINPGCFNDKRILELGAGTGLVGLVCTLLNNCNSTSRVILTDLDYCLPIIDKNMNINIPVELRHIVSVMELSWGKDLYIDEKFDYIFAADCVYLESTFDLLVDTLCVLCPVGSDTRVLLSSKKRRKADKRFLLKLRKHFDIYIVCFH